MQARPGKSESKWLISWCRILNTEQAAHLSHPEGAGGDFSPMADSGCGGMVEKKGRT